MTDTYELVPNTEHEMRTGRGNTRFSDVVFFLSHFRAFEAHGAIPALHGVEATFRVPDSFKIPLSTSWLSLNRSSVYSDNPQHRQSVSNDQCSFRMT